MTKGWCQEENIYVPKTTTRRVSMTYEKLNLTLTSIATYGSAKFENTEVTLAYPSNRAAKFNVQNNRLT